MEHERQKRNVKPEGTGRSKAGRIPTGSKPASLLEVPRLWKFPINTDAKNKINSFISPTVKQSPNAVEGRARHSQCGVSHFYISQQPFNQHLTTMMKLIFTTTLLTIASGAAAPRFLRGDHMLRKLGTIGNGVSCSPADILTSCTSGYNCQASDHHADAGRPDFCACAAKGYPGGVCTHCCAPASRKLEDATRNSQDEESKRKLLTFETMLRKLGTIGNGVSCSPADILTSCTSGYNCQASDHHADAGRPDFCACAAKGYPGGVCTHCCAPA